MILKSCGVHDGTFHADEVTACALLLLFGCIEKNQIVRTRDLKILESCEYVCDVGGIYDPKQKRFDHHQADYQGDLSSAGMVWKYLYEKGAVDEATYDYFNRSLIWGVDAHDNGRATLEVGVCTFSHVITNFVPAVYDAPDEEQTAAFFAALDFAHGHVTRLLERYRYTESCKELVIEAMQSKGKYLIFEKAIPWMDVFFDRGGEKHPAQYLVMPSGNHWKVRGIPPTSHDRMKVRRPLPEAWAGLMGDELKKVSGIEGAIFCHKGRFISVWETKEAAMKALEKIL